MKNISANFTIVKEKNCPLYKVDERLQLSEKTLSCPKGKEMCLILIRDLTELLFTFLQEQPFDLDRYAGKVYNCSGCTGLIKFSLVHADDPAEPLSRREAAARAVPRIDASLQKAYGNIVNCPLLQALPADQLESMLGLFQEIVLNDGAILIRKGEKNYNIYIVGEGELIVESGGVHLATLAAGEICGEMSYLGADVAVSTVKARNNAKVLAIAGDLFGGLLGNNGEVQAYMAQLLAARLRRSDAARARDFASCMSGRIAEIVPAELFQIFHMHQKTGVLSLDLPDGQAKVSFREGCIINAGYGDKANEEAIFKILAEKRGFYRFTTGLSAKEMKAAEIGDFMMLLMEGVKRVDEEQER